jgi:alanyl-tRNA synthetase
MLGNFSFGDYFKRDAIRFAWEFVTKEMGLDPRHLRVTVFHDDDEARQLWREVSGLPESRIYGLGEKDNFWQMADTGPCGPCSEIYVDLAAVASDWRFPEGASGEWTDTSREDYSEDAFVEGAEAGRFLEIWNLVFMQFDRAADGTLTPLPRPSIDTGAGLERIAAVKQGVTSNFHTDVFAPLLQRVEEVVGIAYRGRESDELHTAQVGGRTVTVDPAAFRVLADHARAVAFLLADGVFPSNEGRGYVLRRILRRAVRHAWIMGRTEPTLVHVVERVVETMSDVYPELAARRSHLLETTRAEEERFLATIDEGMARFDRIAPPASTQGSSALRGTISGDDAFRLYDTFGFPIDLTELMARERGYTVDISGFESALQGQRAQSQEERRSRHIGVAVDELSDLSRWDVAPDGEPDARFVGYDVVEITTEVTALRRLDGNRVAMLLRESPFYAESGGQVSDHGEIVGDGWRMDVEDVKKISGRPAAVGTLRGDFRYGTVVARVPSERRRDTERNHTATHLLHAALRTVLGEHVHQAGSLVSPDKLRFDFTHHGPLKAEQLAAVEEWVNEGIWRDIPVRLEERSYQEAVQMGAMALFGEKYGDVVRVVAIPGLSMELCGGTHVGRTGQIGLFKITVESGVAAGVRRIEGLTGRRAYEYLRDRNRMVIELADILRSPVDQLPRRVHAVLDDRRTLEKKLDEAVRADGGGNQVRTMLDEARDVGGVRVVARYVPSADAKMLQTLGDALREQLQCGVAVLGTAGDDKGALLAVVSDDVRERGLRADVLVRAVAETVGGRGGGKPHMAQAGIPDATQVSVALERVPAIVERLLAGMK